MDANVDSLFHEAMELAPLDREDLAACLFDRVENDLTPLDPAWDGEVAKRVEELTLGKACGVPAEEVHRKMQERLGEQFDLSP